MTSPQGRSIEFTYFTDGRAQSVKWVTPSSTDVDPTWNFAYQPLTNGKGTTTLQDPNGKTTTYKWDANYRIVETIDPLGHSHSQTWTPNNAVATSTDAKSNTATNTYDPANNNLTKSQSPNLDASTAGRATTYQYTDVNNPYKATNITSPDGTIRAFAYDGAGNQTTSNQGSGSNTQNASLTYNANGTVASATDGNAHTTSYGYDGAGRMTSVTHPAPMGTEALTYDSVGRVRTHTDGKGQITTLSYNNKNQLTTSVSHTGTTITYGYDADGLMTSRNDAIGTWSFGYDALRRVTSKTQPGGFTTTLTYDLAGNIASSTDNNGTTTFTYDDANNMTKLAEPGGSCVGTVSLCSTFTYDENNRRTAATYPNGEKQSTTYDSSGRIEKQYAELGTTKLTDYTYSYKTAAGADDNKLQSVLDGIKGERTTFEYDSHGRLTVPRTYNSGGTKILTGAYTWDGATNRLTSWLSSDSSGTKTYTYNAANELAARGSSALTYDANGSRITGNNSFTATYNDRNQAVTINGVAQTYADSGQTERVTAGAKTFHTGLLGGLVDEVQSGTTVVYVRDNDGNLISQKKNGVRHYFLVDYQASVVALVNTSGVAACAITYKKSL